MGVNATGNIIGGNLNSTGSISATGNVGASNFVASNSLVGASLNISGDATVAGNLSVQGNLIYIDIDDLRIQDPVIQLGGGANGNALTTNDGKDRGTLLNYYVTNPGNAFVGWKNTSGNMFIASNVTIANDVITVNDYGTTEIGQVYAQSGVFVGNLSANYFLGNGSQLTGMYGNTEVAAYLPTYTGNLTALTGNITTTANVQANYFLGNGSQLTGIVSSYGDANVANYLPTYTGNIASLTGNVVTTANISANYFLGNGSQLTGIPDSNAIINGTSTVAIASANGNIFVDVANVGVAQFTQLGVDVLNLNSLGNVTANGNIDAGNVLLSGNITAVVSVTDPKNFSDLTPINGGRAFILDANLVAAGNFGANVSGGGSNTAPVWSDGTNWYIG